MGQQFSRQKDPVLGSMTMVAGAVFLCALPGAASSDPGPHIAEPVSLSSLFANPALSPVPPHLQLRPEVLREQGDHRNALSSSLGVAKSKVGWKRIKVRPGDFINASGEYCRFRDRFDRSAVVSYSFGTENRLRIAVEDGRFKSHPDRSGTTVMLSFHMGRPSHAERCRIDSPLQGFWGSVFNELTSQIPSTSLFAPDPERSAPKSDFSYK